MNEIYTWWDDAVRAATQLAADTRLRHRVTAVRDNVEGVEITVGWKVDLADGAHRRAAIDAEFWNIVTSLGPLSPTTGASS